MAENKKKNSRPISIPQTKGVFQLAGIVSDTMRNNFYTEKNTSSNIPRRSVNFSIQYNEDEKNFVSIAGMEQKSVYFSKFSKDEATGKRTNETIEVPWKERNSFTREGFNLNGTKVGLETYINEKGETNNRLYTFVPFDACEYINKTLEDGMCVYARGNLTYSTYNDEHYKSFDVNQLYLNKYPIDFKAENFKPTNDFTQKIVFMGIKPDEDKPNRWILSAKIVGYSNIEDVEFIVEDKVIAVAFRRGLKPYDSIDIFGHVRITKGVEEANVVPEGEIDFSGGKVNPMNVRSTRSKVELICDGGENDTHDTGTYTEENIAEAVRILANIRSAKKDYGDKDADETDVPAGFKSSAALKLDDDDDDDVAW